MEIRHLRCFMALAEELHFARAAAKLHIEQSPLSRTIKELEEELGAQLFIRNTRSTRLTRAGLMLMEGSSQKTESMVTPVFATPILTTSWLA
ncbi:LysR family transcriptional regulator [Salmonella enterica]|nr:LysR family transcriptional regulator [Salmonella enterica]